MLVEAPAVVLLCGQWLSFIEGSTCTYLLGKRAPMAVRWGLCVNHGHIQLDHRNNIPSVLIYHLRRLYILVVTSTVYFITHESTESKSR